MKKMFSTGLVMIAGMVSVQDTVSPFSHVSPAPDYRRDPRLKSLRSFFDKANCPAWKYSAVFLEAADTYDLDWRLLPSISYVESTGGKSAPHNNLFGWDSGKAQFATP